MTATVVAGGLWGDEGKGKVVAYLALRDEPAIIARGGVGPNAGHTVFVEGRKYVMRQVPVGFVQRKARLLIGPGVLVDPEVTLDEVARLKIKPGRLGIDGACTVIEPEHRREDQSRSHLVDVVGTTGTGTGPANEARVGRRARLARDDSQLAPYIADVAAEVGAAIAAGDQVLVEGSQGLGLSLYHGDYPYCTSKDTSASALCADVGLGPTNVANVVVVLKAYASRVGNGPFPTELDPAEVEIRGWAEFGAVTGRPRRIGEFDYERSARAVMISGATDLAITNLDRRFPGAAGVRDLEGLPPEARAFVDGIEERLAVPATLLSTGPDAWEMIDRR